MEESRDVWIKFRVTEEERARISKIARAGGLALSTWIRFIVLNEISRKEQEQSERDRKKR